MLAANEEEGKERCMEANREKRKVKRCIYQRKEKVNEQFGRKINEDMNGNQKLFWKEVSNAKRKKSRELQQNIEWKWEVGTRRGCAKALKRVF